MDSEKEKNRLSDIVLERFGLTGNLLSDPVSPSPEPAMRMPGHERQVGAGKVTDPEEYILAMHSACELMGVRDMKALSDCVTAFFGYH